MQPQSTNTNFDFMLKENPQPKQSLLPTIPRPAKIALIVILAIFGLIIVFSLFSGRNKGSTQGIVAAVSRGQETLRVTAIVQQQLHLQEPQTQALAATVSTTLSSDIQQMTGYMAKNHIKVSQVQLASATDKSTDSSLQTASQNNNLDSAYINYLKTALAKYESDLQASYKSAGPNGKQLLQTAYDSANTLLTTAPLKS
jgi:hypothetical protein